MNAPDKNRRRFLVSSAVALGSLPLIGQALRQPAHAADLPPLPESNAQAAALKYTTDASKATAPNYKAGSDCANCQFFHPDTKGCTLFAGFSVEPKGWCSAWAAKA
ncbi:MAG: high-potential iron-sulfur protein [Dokdonella sp.]